MTSKETTKTELSPNTLLIIPCCKTKIQGGNSISLDYQDPLKELISNSKFQDLLSGRAGFEEYLKDNRHFLPAIDRYNGNLYRVIPNFASEIKKRTNGVNQPKLIILSALYGPLHPLSLINDYELQMPKNRNHYWYYSFPSFLKDYVRSNKISSIKIYCGKSTGYSTVLTNAIKSLREQDKIDDIIRYDVTKGSSLFTPQNHGLQLCFDLQVIKSKEKFTRPINPIKI